MLWARAASGRRVDEGLARLAMLAIVVASMMLDVKFA